VARRKPGVASRSGLTVRLLVISGLLALIVAAMFAVLLLAINAQSDAAQHASDSHRELTAADGLEKLVLDLETGVRGLVITREERFLQRGKRPGRPSRSARGSSCFWSTIPDNNNWRSAFAPFRTPLR
jgi:hypothetical protein